MSIKIGDKVHISGIFPLNYEMKSFYFKEGTIIDINYYKTYPYSVLIGEQTIKCLSNQVVLSTRR